MGFFAFSRANQALPSAAEDLLTIIPASSRQFEIIEISLVGLGTASDAGEVQLARSTGGTTGGGALTARPLRFSQIVFGGTNFTTWTSQPTVTEILLDIGVNANGGAYRWIRVPGVNLIFVQGDTRDQASFRVNVSGPSVAFHTHVEEY